MLGAVYLSCCCFGVSLLAFVLSYLLVEKVREQEKSSVYECGFDPYEIARIPFSVRFFLVGILFIIFDLEVVFLFPWLPIAIPNTIHCIYIKLYELEVAIQSACCGYILTSLSTFSLVS